MPNSNHSERPLTILGIILGVSICAMIAITLSLLYTGKLNNPPSSKNIAL